MVLPAYAEENTDDVDPWQPAFTLTTDKASYAAGDQITVTATATNDLDAYVLENGGETKMGGNLKVMR